MDIIQMHSLLDLGLQRIGSNALENFYPEEVDVYLNNAINKYVKALSNEIRGAGGNHVAAHENLRTIVKYGTVTLSAHTLTNSFSGSLPSDFHLYLSCNLVGNTSGSYFRGEYVVPDEFLRSLPTLADTPVFRHFPVTMVENKLLVAKDSTLAETLASAVLLYVKSPATVIRDDAVPANNVSCDLPGHAHQEIVDIAVGLMSEDLQHSGPKRDDPKPRRQGEVE